MPTRTIAYLRVSTDKQADRGVSLDAFGGGSAANSWSEVPTFYAEFMWRCWIQTHGMQGTAILRS